MIKTIIFVMLCIFAPAGCMTDQVQVIQPVTVVPHMPEVQSLNDIPNVNLEYDNETDNIDVHAQIDYIDETERQIVCKMNWINTYGNKNTVECKAALAEAEDMRVYYTNLSTYTYADLRMLAVTIAYEANGCTTEHKEYVAQVVLNRCNDDRFPDNIYDVLTQKNQYHPMYVLREKADYWKDISIDVWNSSVNAAMSAMMGMVEMPEDVIYQSEYKNLGFEIWKQFEVNFGSYTSTTYFSRG